MKPEISVVIPVYNEQAGLQTLFDRLYPALDKLGSRYEIVFVNDGSRDNSVSILAEQFRARPDVTRVVLFNGNYGQHMAILAGFEAARGEIMITLDADLQNPPEEIGNLVAKMREGYDYVGSIRRKRQDAPGAPMPKAMNHLRENITNIKITDQGNMLRAYGRNVIDLVNQCGEVNTFVPALAYALRATRPKSSSSTKSARPAKYSLYSLIRLNFDLVTGFSLVPLQFFSMIGILLSLASALLVPCCWCAACSSAPRRKACSRCSRLPSSSWAFMFGIGLLGEYVGRIFQQVRARPRYVVQPSSNSSRAYEAPQGVEKRTVGRPHD
jgi:undecaprenyl-phosphate 4-deoxy-4-formamido-L-arabinose transferase